MIDEPITLSELAADGIGALNRLRAVIDRTQRAAMPMNDAWVILTEEVERALVGQSRYQDTLMRDVQTALGVLARRTEECESLRAQLSEAQADTRAAAVERAAEMKQLLDQMQAQLIEQNMATTAPYEIRLYEEAPAVCVQRRRKRKGRGRHKAGRWGAQ